MKRIILIRIVSSAMLIIASILSTFWGYWGVDSNGNLKVGYIILIAILLIIHAIVNSFLTILEIKSKSIGNINNIILECDLAISDNILNIICLKDSNKTANLLNIVRGRMKQAFIEFNKNLTEDDICINLYVFDNNKWDFIDRENCTSLSMPQLEDNKSTVLNKLKNSDKPNIFYPDKKKAAKDGDYVFGAKDQQGGNGSIIAEKLHKTFGSETESIQAILFITTYNEMICKDNKRSKKRVSDQIIKHFKPYFFQIVALQNWIAK